VSWVDIRPQGISPYSRSGLYVKYPHDRHAASLDPLVDGLRFYLEFSRERGLSASLCYGSKEGGLRALVWLFTHTRPSIPQGGQEYQALLFNQVVLDTPKQAWFTTHMDGAVPGQKR